MCAAIGATLPSRAPAHNELTRLCMEAVRLKCRPSYQLGVREDMPDEIWETAIDTIGTGWMHTAIVFG